jgi:CRISPR-associated protein Csh2
LLEIEYSEHNQKIYGVDRLIELKPKDDKKGEQLRSMDDYELDFSKLFEKMGKSDNESEDALKNSKIAKVHFYTEIDSLKKQFEIAKDEEENPKFEWKKKFEAIKFVETKKEDSK